MAHNDFSRGRMAVTGMFDGVHAGHLSLLGQARREADRRGLSLMAVTFARHPLEEVAPERAPQLLMTAARREQMLRAVADEVVVLDFGPRLRALTMEEFMRMLRDDYGARAIFMGFNHRFGSDCVTDPALYREAAARLGLDVVTGSEEQVSGSKVSSSVIRRSGTADRAYHRLPYGQYHPLGTASARAGGGCLCLPCDPRRRPPLWRYGQYRHRSHREHRRPAHYRG